MSLRALLLVAIMALVPFSTVRAVELSADYDPGLFEGRATGIDPDTTVYGVPFGSSVDDVRAAFGSPRGVVIVSRAKRALFYGRSHLFVFVRGKLRELVVDPHTVHWLVANQIEIHPFFDGDRWSLGPGISDGMTFPDVLEALGRPEVNPDHEYRLDGDRSSTTLRFSLRRDALGAESYVLYSFAITHYGD